MKEEEVREAKRKMRKTIVGKGKAKRKRKTKAGLR